ncbi:unnamed protein product [Lymnaea stagnalis]|uniref:RCC1-like domain-containing protein n=1 Tax=Lymnaea stagnalis TaxID=6523 RepID=A0AAV2I6G6_LYMST
MMWSWGANNSGQLGLGNHDDQIVPSICVPLPALEESDDFKQAGGGGGYSYILTKSGKVLTCGNNDRGQLGHGDKHSLMVFSLSQRLTAFKMVQIAAGWDFMLGLTDGGQLLSWGSNSFGQLGRLAAESSNELVPGEVSGFKDSKIVAVAAGLRHAISLTESGQVYTWGNGRKGQLGCVEADGNPLQKTQNPILVQFPQREIVVCVTAGMYHSGISTDAGNIHVWGCNKYGQCSADPKDSSVFLNPHVVFLPVKEQAEGSKIVALTSGWTHLIARTASGDLYSWGRGDLGQLGRKCEQSYDYKPKQIVGLHHVKSQFCGSEHNLALTDDNNVYSWGWNEHGICGTGDEQNVMYPTKVPAFIACSVVAIGCGTGHSFCYAKDTH